MIFPSIDELTQGKFNRYELVIATSKGARKIVDAQILKREEIDKVNMKDPTDKNPLKYEAIEEKAVKTALMRISNHEYIIKNVPIIEEV